MSRLDDLILLNKIKRTAQNLKGVSNVSIIDDIAIYNHTLIKLKEFNAIDIVEKYDFIPFSCHDFIEFFEQIISPTDDYILPLSHIYMMKCNIISPKDFLQSYHKLNFTLELELFNNKSFMVVIEDDTKDILFYIDKV